ncbi:bacteriohemerythrin [Azotosporobacter soli]|uniref:bacteriohemerythrin n=1 Tax=Azotosporobacter soli TaxID=3055040 RepID=UPI0031FF2575
MSILKWNEKYQTGVKQFDQEHQQLLQRFNDLYTNIFECETLEQERKLTAEVLQDLLDYVQYHFTAEEELMKKHHYPEYEEHQKAHGYFIKEVTALLTKHEGGELALSFPIFSFVKEWIDNHILIVDKRYSEFFKNKLEQ